MGPKTRLAAALLALWTAAAYLPALKAGFIWDDDSYVTENRTLSEPGGLRDIWLDPFATPQYYPLVHTSFWLEHRLWGLSPAGTHAVNVALHAAAALLAWLVGALLGLRAAWLAAALFALHPVHVETAAWVTERKNLLSAVFYLLAMAAWVRRSGLDGRAPPAGAEGRLLYAVALSAFAAALLSKTVACTLPAAALVLVWWKRGRVARRDVLELAPFFALGAALGLVTVWLEAHHVGARGEEFALSAAGRLVVAGRALWFYAGKLAWPSGLSFVYPRWAVDPSEPAQAAAPALALAALAALWLGRGRWGRGPLAAALFFAGTLFPALGFFDVYPMKFSFVADHFQYLASLGPLAAAAAALAALERRFRLSAPALSLSVLLALSLLSWRRAGVFRDAETLWRDTLERNPGCWMCLSNLGTMQHRQGRAAEAAESFEAVLRLKPDHPAVLNELAVLRLRQGRLDEAERMLREALRLRPDHAPAHNNLGAALYAKGELAAAAESFRRALRLRPGLLDARANLEAFSATSGR